MVSFRLRSLFARIPMLLRPTPIVPVGVSATASTAGGDFAEVPAMACRTIVLSGPSGGGKSTILDRAMKSFPGCFAFSVSHTTRQPRDGEQNGVHYWFTSKEDINRMIEHGEFLEYATFGGNTYGTSKKAVEDVEKSGKICVLDLELQGVKSIKATHLKCKYILVRPPSLEVLEARLRNRNTETEETLQKRLNHARDDLEAVSNDPTLFDHVIVNDNLDSAYDQFVRVLEHELHNIQKQ